MTSTATVTVTRTRTAIFLSDLVISTVADILAALGVDGWASHDSWVRDSQAIAAWIEEGSLAAVVVEFLRPNGTTDPIIEFPVVYRSEGTGDAEFVSRRAVMARYRAKLVSVPRGTRFRLICTYNGPHRDMPGWGPTERAAVDGMQRYAAGTLGFGPGAAASMRWFTRG